MSSLLGFWRVKRWESSIRASQPRVITPEEQPEQGRGIFANAQTTLAAHSAFGLNPGAHSPSAQNEVEMGLRQLEEEEGLRTARSAPDGNERGHTPDEDEETARFENRLRRDLNALGYM